MVVPIEDSEYTPSSVVPEKSPVRTDMTKEHQKQQDEEKSDCVVVDEMSIPLPGTPTNDREGEEGGSSASRDNKSAKSRAQLVLNMDGGEVSQENMIPDSPRSSESFSSRGSTRSTDILLPKEK